jgi:hypothetical protein
VETKRLMGAGLGENAKYLLIDIGFLLGVIKIFWN